MDIYKCKNSHYSIITKENTSLICSICGARMEHFSTYQEGDCVACGQLCPSHAYSCTNPHPYKKDSDN